MNVVLIGMKHCGKSTLGSALAARWACPFHDVDQLVETRHERETGQRQTVREMFVARGEGYFDEMETQVVRELHKRLSGTSGSNVIAVGGRTALNEKVGELLKSLGLIVFLEISPEELWPRVERGGLPPFVNPNDPAQHFLQLYLERVPHYRRLAHLTVNLDRLDPDAALGKLCKSLGEHTRSRDVS